MNTDLPAAVSPFDAAFDGPESASCQEIGTQQVTVDGESELMIYEKGNPFAWITCDKPLDVGGR